MGDRELMKQALEALECLDALQPEPDYYPEDYMEARITITALRERLAQPEQSRAEKMRDAGYTRRPTLREIASAGEQPEQEPVCAHGVGKTKCDFCKQPEQEPVAWIHELRGLRRIDDIPPSKHATPWKHTPLYTHAPRREWVGLTEDEIVTTYGGDLNYRDGDYLRYARAIEAKLKENNHG